MKLKNILLVVVILSVGVAACSKKAEKPASVSNVSPAEIKAGRALISDNCSGCHAAAQDGSFSRISFIRKTPEGWDMNIARMMNFHGLEIAPKDRRGLVKFLSDTRGLAPAETTGRRAILERKPNVIEQNVDPDLRVMCARCHSYARIALQRRDTPEWRNLVNMHLGQWASIEYQMLARERDWRADALGPVSTKLGKMYPLKTVAWAKWQKTKWKDLSGSWRIVGHWPGKGNIDGVMTVTPRGTVPGKYQAVYKLVFTGGQKVTATGKSIVYTGYEWRGGVTLAGRKFRQIWAATKDGNRMTGRMFVKDHSEDGMEISARRIVPGQSAIMNIVPAALKVGVATRVVINGINLSGKVAIAGAGVTVTSLSANRIVLTATAAGTTTGLVTVSVGKDV
ncbi:MAG: quinohemoprotein amine dehydrogenase subunit alpha, partial [Alphaproteobacteria bacterium]|nr:quinohemoprotein amine dehydrogenase subunit alpha [Alphaproteobacteria bacterium]